MKRMIAGFLAVFALALAAQAQSTLTVSSSIPVVDGSLGPDEYQFNTTISGMTLGATLGTDGMVYLAIQADTAGWVALGVGGLKMNGARLFLAYDTGSKKVFSEQLGSGHFHGDVKDPVTSKWAVVHADGKTTLELALPSSAAIANGKLELLFSYSDTTSFTAYHKARGALSIPVE